MKIKLAYGKKGMEIDLPDAWDVTVLEPRYMASLPNEPAAIADALAAPIGLPPLAEFVKSTDRLGIIFNDITRATPNHLIVPAILAQIPFVPEENIILFNALGTHRVNTDAELRGMLGDALVDRYRIVQNNAFEESTQVSLGMNSRGNEVWLNRELVDCDVKILTGFIEPHLFAGFSGGGKAVMPGMAGLNTIMRNHTPDALMHPSTTWGMTLGNPLWEEITEIASKLTRIYLLNVALNKYQQVTAVFAGDLRKAHAVGCDFVRETAMAPVNRPFDIVVTTNSGYPLDQNLYQSIKGMSAAAQIVKKNGVILTVSECSDGLPDHGLYARLLKEAGSPGGWQNMVNQPGFQCHDQWQMQLHAMLCLHASVYVYSDYLSDEQIQAAWLKPCRNIVGTLARLTEEIGHPRIAVLPEGPQTVPFLCG